MTNQEAIRWLQLDIEMMKFDPSTGEGAYLNDDAKKTLEALDMAITALGKDIDVPSKAMVYRQDAIDTSLYTDGFNDGYAQCKRDAQDTSAQPDIVRCKDCKYYTDKLSLSTVTHGPIPKLCIVLARYLYENDYCSYGVRKDG